MKYTRSVSLVLAVAATAMLVTGSFGFTSVTAERNVSINVVDSENAYVDVSVCANANSNGDGNGASSVTVTVKNQFSEAFTVEEIAWSDDAHSGGKEWNQTNSTTIQPGNSETFNGAFGDDEVTVTVSGGVDARVTEDVGPQCKGNGNDTATENETETETGTED